MVAAMVALAATASSAHEFWIEPDFGSAAVFGTPASSPSSEVALRMFVGERFAGEELAWNPARAREFRAIDARGIVELAGEAGAAPAAWLPSSDGVRLVSYRSVPSVSTLQPNAFARYLRHEGFDSILEIRRARGEENRPGRERFTRYCKTIIPSATPASSSPNGRDPDVESRVLGHRLEIVPVESKGRGRPADERAFRILFEGAPLGAAIVRATPKSDPVRGLVQARTDSQGLVRFRLDRSGPWLVTLVHMVECAGCPDADWDSSWASLVLSPSVPIP
jgi:hypothetical protein